MSHYCSVVSIPRRPCHLLYVTFPQFRVSIAMAAKSPAVFQDSRKRTLEALERRFAFAKAELTLQQKRTSNLSSEAPHSKNKCIPQTPFGSSSIIKDAEEDVPEYSPLSHPVHENLLRADADGCSTSGTSVDGILLELLRHGDSAEKYTNGSRSLKMDNWILLDNYVRGGRSASFGSRARTLRAHSKRSKKHMSLKQHKKIGSFYLPQESHKFSVFRPMHEMWIGYMNQLLKTAGKNQLAQCLLDADLHGAIIIVAESKITTFTGLSGIMIRETAEAFGIITKEDKIRVVPKKGSIFVFQVNCWKVTVVGDKFTSRQLQL